MKRWSLIALLLVALFWGVETVSGQEAGDDPSADAPTPPPGFPHEQHPENDCADCHTEREQPVAATTCTTCHDQSPEALAAFDLPVDMSLLDAQVRLDELESERASVQAQGENLKAVRTMQGLAVGLFVGGAAMLLITSLRRNA